MEWIAKLAFPWLLKRAMKLGAKAFGKVNTRKHAILSRKWMWSHAWLPMRNKILASKNKLDDPIATFIYVNQACCLEDGSAKELTATIRKLIAEGDKAKALVKMNKLEVLLGIDKDYN